MTTVQASLNEFHAFQDKEGYQLAGCGPRMKTLAGEIKVLFPTLTEADKALFLAAVARGRFSIESKYIWPLFCEAVGAPVPVPAPKPAAPAASASPAPAPATNKVAAEILEHCQSTRTVVGLLNKTLEAMLLTLESQADRITALTEKVEAMKRPVTKRSLASV